MRSPHLIKVRIESLGTYKSLKASKPPFNPFMLGDAYLHVPGTKYPQLIQYFASDAVDVLQPGLYDVPVEISVKDGRPQFTLLYRDREVVTPSASAPARANA